MVESLREIERSIKINPTERVKNFYNNNGLMIILDVYYYYI